MLFGGAVLLVAVALRRDRLWGGWRPFGYAAVAAAFFAADLACWHRAIGYVGPGLATILGNFQVFFLAAFGIFVFREKPDAKYLISIPIAILGLALLVGIEANGFDRDSRLGLIFGFATAVTYAGYVLILQKSQARGVRLSPLSNLAVISFLTAGLLAGESAIHGESFHIPDAWSWTAMLGYGILCQALGWLMISRGLTRVAASRAGLILVLQPMLAFVWDVVIFSRPTGLQDAAGAAIAGVAIWLGTTSRRVSASRTK
jgi:drug/metabolite transporter (DMT)-like permease